MSSKIDRSSSEKLENVETEILFQQEAMSESSAEDPPEKWTSFIVFKPLRASDKKMGLHAKGLYSPGSGEICAKYIRQSDSSVLRHAYYNYPAVLDPGIKEALLEPKPPHPPYPSDGIQLYLDQCKENNVCPIRLFYSNLLNPEINLAYYCPTSDNVRIMAMALRHNRHVKRLDLTDNFLDLDACYHLGQMLRVNTTLQELILDGCRIQEAGLRRIGDATYLNVSLHTISLARNDLGDVGGELFANFIELGANYTRINLRYNKLGMKTAYALHEALLYKNNITHLDLSWNTLTHTTSTVKLFQTLAESEYLEELNLSFMGLENERIADAIAELTRIETLKVLNINNNRFSDACAELLVANLPESNLISYDLSNNVFTPSGACSILQMLTNPMVKLQKLYLDNICVNRKFMEILGRIKKMKIRKNFEVTFDKVLHDWVAIGDDPRALVLRRGDYMGKMKKGNPKDVPMFLLSLSHAVDSIRAKELTVMMKDQKMPVNDDWIAGLIQAFPGPVVDKKPTVDAIKMREYMRRLWPDLKLPPNWKPPVMIRVDVKNKKPVAKGSNTDLKKKK